MPRVLVTGANRGLGLETCRQLVARGYEVLLTARDSALGQEAARQAGIEVQALGLDVTREESVLGLAALLKNEPPLDALINNAGTALDGFDAEVAARTIDVNYKGAIRVTDALLPQLAPGSNVVMVSSGMGELSRVSPELRRQLLDPALDRQGLHQLVAEFIQAAGRGGDLGGWPQNAYSVSKIALNTFTRILASSTSAEGHRINAVCPGWVRTRMGGASATKSLEEGAQGIVWAATLAAGGPSGGFFRDAEPIGW